MKKFFLFLIGLFIGFIVFIPKDNLYYTLQKYLSKEKIYINSDIKNSLILTLSNGKIYQNGINFAQFEKVKIIPFLVYNNIKAKNIKISFQNIKIDNLNITYSIINPLKIKINGTSNIGKINGEVNLIKKIIKIYILNLNNNTLKSFLRKDKQGYFYYEKF